MIGLSPGPARILVAVLGSLLAGLVLAGAALAAFVSTAVPAEAAGSPDGEGSSAERIVVVGVPGLVWGDVAEGLTPAMIDMADTGAIGLLSVRSVNTLTCPDDGWLTLSAGRRASGEPRPRGGCPPRSPYLTPVVGAAGGTVVPEMPEIVEDNATTNDRAVPGLLADSVRCTGAVGQGGAIAAADPQGLVTRYLPSLPATAAQGGSSSGLGDLIETCPVTVVAAARLESDPVVRTGAVIDIDRVVAAVRAAAPPETVILVLGVSEIGADLPGLHVAIAWGPGFERGWLTSASTLHTPYVQLIDGAPTALSVLGTDFAAMTGKPMHTDGSTSTGRTRGALDEDLRLMRDLTVRARLQQNLMGPFDIAWALSGIVAGAVVAVLWVYARRSADGAVLRKVAMVSAVVGVAYAAVPVATFLANLVPWWTTGSWGSGEAGEAASGDGGSPGAVLALAVSGAVGVVAALALGGPWRRSRLGPFAAVGLVTALVIGIDAATGSRLEMDSMLGFSPLVAGRFTGMSNMAFAAFAVGALAFLGVAAHGRTRAAAVAVLLLGGGLATVLVAARGAGNDFGGTIAFVPAVAVLAVQLLGGRLTWPRIGAALAAAVAVVGVVSLVDYRRPPEDRGHFGSFLEDLLTGEAWEVMRRKAEALLVVVFATPVTFLVPFLLAGLTYLLVRPRGTVPMRLATTMDESPPLREALVACAVCACLGFAVNDSGVALAGTAIGMAVPAAMLGVAWTRRLRSEADGQ